MKNKKNKPTKVFGKKYKSITEAANAHGLNRDLVYSRIKNKGITAAEAIMLGKGNTSVLYKGVEYENLTKLSERIGVEPATMNSRMESGYSVEMIEIIGKRIKSIFVFGQKFESKAELCEAYGINLHSFVHFENLHKTFEQVVLHMLKTEKLVFQGKEYQSLTQLCREHGIDSTNVTKRIGNGWTVADALFTPVAKIGLPVNQYTIGSVTYNTKREAAESYGISLSLIGRIEAKWKFSFEDTLFTLDEFLTKYPQKGRSAMISQIPFIIYGDEWFASYSSFPEVVNLDYHKLKTQMDNNGISEYYEGLVHMKNLEREYSVDNQTGEERTVSELRRKYKITYYMMLKEGILGRKSRKAYPDCTFNPNLYFATPSKDFTRHMDELARKREG